MVDDAHSPVALVERGVASLRRWLGEGASLLRSAKLKQGEIASFEYPLPIDYMGVERTVRIAFLTKFPIRPLEIVIDPSPWLEWPHAMPGGVCLFGMRQRPVSGSPEEVVDESLRRLGQLVELVMPDGDSDLRQREFEDEIFSYWSQQLDVTPGQLVLVHRPKAAAPLLVLTDTHSRKDAVRASTWLAPDTTSLECHWRRMTGERRHVRAPAAAAFYLPLTSVPFVRVPRASGILEWLQDHTSETGLAELSKWDKTTSGMPQRWLVLRLPGEEMEVPHHCALVLRSSGMKKGGQKTYGRRAARRAAHGSIGSSKLRAMEYAQIHVLDREQVHSRDVIHSGPAFAAARVVIVGVGSLGSAIASHLARAGVGHLTLVDSDLLEDANLGRHVLGIDDLGRFKANALAERLRHDVPNIEVNSITEFVQFAYGKHRTIFDEADLIISTSADWPCELALWEIKAQGATWTLIQSWSEPHAQIGHALLAPPGAYDGRNLFDASGRFRFRLSQWPNDGIRALPGCGSSFIPGGPVAMVPIAGMVAQAAIGALIGTLNEPAWHTSIGNPKAIPAAGGTYIGPPLPDGAIHLNLARAWPDLEGGEG